LDKKEFYWFWEKGWTVPLWNDTGFFIFVGGDINTAKEFLMKKRIFAVALVVMLLGAGLVLMSCSKCPGDGDCVSPGNISDTWKWCADSVVSTDKKDVEKAASCAANSWATKGDCDC